MKFWWKAYFWLVVVLVIATVILQFQFGQMPGPSDFFDYGVWLFSMVGVFGFAYSKLIVGKRLWQVWLPVVLIWDIGLMAKQYVFEPMEMEPWFMVVVLVIGGILVLPEYLALYLYGYRSDSLWSSKINRKSG